MSKVDIIRAWKDKAYRAGLSDQQLSECPESPVGAAELTEDFLDDVLGATTEKDITMGCCTLIQTDCGTCAGGTTGCCAGC